jgi:hypothetical protein
MARTRITEHEVSALRNASRRSGKTIYLWDTELRDLGVRITAGRCAWLMQKRVGGRGGTYKRFVIGLHPQMTIEEARNRVRAGQGAGFRVAGSPLRARAPGN